MELTGGQIFAIALTLFLGVGLSIFAGLFWKKTKTKSQKFLLVICFVLAAFWLSTAWVGLSASSLSQTFLGIQFVVATLIPGLIYFGLAGIIGDFAKVKGRSWAAFFWLSVFFTPLILWIVAASISPIIPPSVYSAPVRPAPQSEASRIAGDIEKLGELKDKGLISQTEFRSKKKELLDRL